MTKRKPSWFDPQLEQSLDAPAREAIAWFNRLRADRVSDEDREAFAAWLQADTAHAAAFQEIEQLWRGLSDMPEARKRRRKAVTRRTVTKGAVALLLAGGAWGAYRAHPFADYRTGVGERLTVKLPDGSTVQLSTSTALSVDDDLATRRVILHAGEAFFEVAPNAGRPFVVDAGDGTVTALGTAFAVSDTGAGTVVTVTQHAVRIDAAARQVKVEAGMQATFTGRGIGAPAAVDEAVALAWRQGRLVFVNARLDRVLDALNRWQSGRMVVLNSALAAHPVTLIVNLDDVEDARRQLEDALPIAFTSVAPYLTLVHAR
jgi:transmembrane sensor